MSWHKREDLIKLIYRFLSNKNVMETIKARGYKLVKAVDQFCHSVHVEVVLLSHKKPDGHINVKVDFGEGECKVPWIILLGEPRRTSRKSELHTR